MTAPAAAAPFRKIPIFLKFPPDHWLAGLVVERGRLCVCGERFFLQSLVNTEYLDSLRGHQSQMFVSDCCEIENRPKNPPGFRIWTPARCPQCERERMNKPVQPALAITENTK